MRLHRAGIGGVVLLAAVAVLAIVLVMWHGSDRGGPLLPATPMAWLDAFSAGVARDSGDVCSRLLSSEFRAAMQRDAHESCTAYYRSAQVLSIRVLRILRRGETAAIEIRYFPHGGYSTFVLDRLGQGWGSRGDRAWRPAADRLSSRSPFTRCRSCKQLTLWWLKSTPDDAS